MVSAGETLDEAIAGAREVEESRSKVENTLMTDLTQPVVDGSPDSHREQNTSPSPSQVEPAT
jgi:hypothetical protein